jgi:hypothetical protein
MMKQWFRTLKQLWKYHSEIDVKQALDQSFWEGMQAEKREASKHSCCHVHTGTSLVFIAEGLYGCPRCRQIAEPMLPVRRPTIRLTESTIELPHSGKMGPDTSLHVAINMLKEGQTGVMHKIGQMQAVDDVPTQALNKKKEKTK